MNLSTVPFSPCVLATFFRVLAGFWRRATPAGLVLLLVFLGAGTPLVTAALTPEATAGAAAVTWNPMAEFSAANGNPNGVWSYGWMDTSFTTFSPYVNKRSVPGGYSNWYGWGGDETPAVGFNARSTAINGVPPGYLLLHPGNGTEPSVLRWTAPLTAAVRVIGQFSAGDVGTMQVAVRHNNTVLFTALDAGAFDLAVNVTAGDTLNFAVYGGYISGSTGLQVTLAATTISLPLTTGEAGKISLGALAGGSSVSIAVTGTGDLADARWSVNPDGSLAAPASGPWAFANPTAAYPAVAGFPAGDGVNRFVGGGANYDYDGMAWPFAGKQTTDTADPATIRFGAVVGTFVASPTRSDWFLIGTGRTVTVPAGGATLYLAVNETASTNNHGTYSVTASAVAPANDTFANAVVLTGSNLSVPGASVGAGKEAGEINHAGNAGGASVWWKWTAPKTGVVTVNTIGSAFDTLLAVYTGTAVNALTAVASDDNSGPANTSKLTFSATAGTTYQIAVDGSGGATGSIVLNLGYAYHFSTFAGLAGSAGSTNATGGAARFSGPNDVVVDANGNLYVGENVSHTIRKITAAGVVSTLAGSAGLAGTANGTGPDARFKQPLGLALDGGGNVLVADYENHAIRMVTPAGVVSTVAGLAGTAGTDNATGTAARFNFPVGLTVDTAGNIFVADSANHVIRKIASGGVVTTFAGTMGTAGSADGTGTAAKFNRPYRLAFDSSGNLFVSDTFNHTIRKITPAGVVTTLAGTVGVAGGVDGAGGTARFDNPYGVAVDANGNVFTADYTGHTLRRITPSGVVATLGGVAGAFGVLDGLGANARFNQPTGVALDSSGNLFIADFTNQTIRKGVPAYAPEVASVNPATFAAGATVTITGANFTAATAVTFNGVAAASFTVVSPTTITAVAPATLTAGNLAVTGPGGASTLTAPFAVGAAGSTFGTDADGWSLVSFTNLSTNTYSVAGTFAATFNASGGNPGGYISSNDPDGGDFTFAAPAAFLGNRTNSIGATLTYQLIHPTGDLNYQAADVILVGNGLRLVWKGNPAIAPASASWTTVTVPLAPSAQWRVGTTDGALAASADFQNVFGNLTGLFLRGEYTNGAETTGLDNVLLGVAVPGTPAVNALAPSAVFAGATVTLTGSGFTGATAVSFNGTAATSFTVVSDLTLTAVVPPGATAGDVTVTTPGGTSATKAAFTVITPAPSAQDRFDPGANGNINAVVVQPDGKIVIGGDFTSLQPFGSPAAVTRTRLARLNRDGTVDSTFAPPAFNNTVRALLLQPDGKLLVGGSFSFAAGISQAGLVRLNLDGSVDGSFTRPFGIGAINRIVGQSDGNLLLGGNMSFGANRVGLIRASADGVLDADFVRLVVGISAHYVSDIAVLPGGSIVIAGYFASNELGLRSAFARLTPTGAFDATFDLGVTQSSVDPTGSRILRQPDGRWLLAGSFNGVAGQTRNNLARLNADFTLDTGFNPNADGAVNELTLQSDGRIVIGGAFANVGGAARARLARLNVDGTLDAAFTTVASSGSGDSVRQIVRQPDGSLLVGGEFTTLGGHGRGRIARLLPDGSVERALIADTDGVIEVAVRQPDGKTIIGGAFTTVAGVARTNLARLNADSTLDTGFYDSQPNGAVRAIVVQPDGLIVIGGAFTSLTNLDASRNGLARLTASGGLDSSFNAQLNGSVTALALQSDGKIIVVGGFTQSGATPRNRAARFTSLGALDTFDPNLDGSVTAIAVQADGKVLLGGSFTLVGAVGRNGLARLDATTGAADSSFNPGANGGVNAIVVLPNQQILVGGQFTAIAGNAANNLARLNSVGGFDGSFNATANQPIKTLALAANGKLAVGGAFTSITNIGSTARDYLALLDAGTGAPDTSFNVYASDYVNTAVWTSDGKLTVAGNFITLGGQPRTRLARLVSTAPTETKITATASTITLTRSGPLPEVAWVTFEKSSDGVTGWTALGIASRVGTTANWQLTGLSLPTSSVLYLRARAAAPSSVYGSSSLIEHVQQVFVVAPLAFTTPPVAQVTSAGSGAIFTVGATGGPALTYQWQRQPAGTTGFTNLTTGGAYAGATTATLVVNATVNMTGDQFRCVIADGLNAALTSTPVPLTVVSGAGIVAVSIPVNSQDATSRPVLDGVWSVAAPPLPLSQSGIGALVKTTFSTANDSNDFALHDHVYPSPNIPDPARAVVTMTFSAPVVVSQLEVIQHQNGVSRIECFVGDSLDSLVSIGSVFGPSGDVVGGSVFAEGVSQVFQFTNSTAARYCRFIIRKTSLSNGWAVHRVFPRDPAGQRILGVTAAAPLIPVVSFLTPISSAPGGTVVLTGSGFSGATAVTFNGVPASAFTVVSDSAISATVPSGALSGPVAVTTSQGTNTTSAIFLAVSPTANDRFDPGANDTVLSAVVQPDGRMVISGNFTTLQPFGSAAPVSRQRIARLNRDGTLDAGFLATASLDGAATTLALQSDGRILLGGSFSTVNGVARRNFARLNPDGSLDSAFDPAPSGPVNAIIVRPDGKIVIGGEFGGVQPNGAESPTVRRFVARLTSAGALDSALNVAFDNGESSRVTALALQPDGSLLIGGTFTAVNGSGRTCLARITPTDALDPAFDAGVAVGGAVTRVVPLVDGRILLAGSFSRIGNQNRSGLAILLAAGTLSAFDPGANSVVNDVAVQADGQIVVAGTFSTIAGGTRNGLARLRRDGTLDAGFTAEANSGVRQLALQPDGSIVVVGDFTTLGGHGRNRIARLLPDGSVERALIADVTPNVVGAFAVQPDGKIILGGHFTSVAGTARNFVARLNADSTLDAGFNPAPDGSVVAPVVLANGQFLIGGRFSAIGGQPYRGIARFNADGSIDPSFNPAMSGGIVNSVLLQPDGKFVVGGTFTGAGGVARNRLARYNADGSIDSGFNPDVNGEVLGLALQSDGAIIFTGSFTAVGGQTRNRLARVSSAGVLDTAFNPDADGLVSLVVIQPDGKVVVTGSFTSVAGTVRAGVARLTASGAIDAAFNPGAIGVIGVYAAQADGKLLATGSFTSANGIAAGSTARLNADGSIDLSFNPAVVGQSGAFAIQPDGKIIIGGDFSAVGNLPRGRLARLTSTGPTETKLSATLSTVTLTRNGPLPELAWVTFEKSSDGTTGWTPLGTASRIGTTAHWQLTGQTLPPNTLLYLRARAAAPTGVYGASSLVEQVRQVYVAVAVSAPTVASLTPSAIVGGGTVTLTGTGFNGAAVVRFNGLAAAFNIVSDSVITATVPLGVTSGAVTVTGPGGTSPATVTYTATVTPVAQTLYVATGQGSSAQLYTVNPATAAAVLVGNITLNGSALTITGLAFHPLTGVLYGVTGNENGPSKKLVTINPATGVASLVGSLAVNGETAVGASDISFDVNGKLFSWRTGGGPLGLVNLATAAVTPIGSGVNGTGGNGLAFTPDGSLYVAGAPSGSLSRVDPATGALTAVANLSGAPSGLGTINAMASNLGGVLFAVGNGDASLITINPATGAITTVGTLPFSSADALAFLIAVPAPTITTPPVATFVAAGGGATLTVAAAGVGPLAYQWQRNGENIPGATTDSYTVTSATQANAGLYRVIVSNAGGSVLSNAVAFDVVTRNLINFYARAVVDPLGNMASSFTVEGTQSKTVLIVGVGGTRAAAGAPAETTPVAGLADPIITVVNAAGTVLGTNDNWTTANSAAVAAASSQVHATPGLTSTGEGTKDAALLLTLAPGTYTATLAGADGGGGAALLQIYDADTDGRPRLVMFTLRASVASGSRIATAGFTVDGTLSKTVLVRALGYSLGNTPDVLADPVISLYRGTSFVADNDDTYFSDGQYPIAVAQVGARPYNQTLDSTLVQTVLPGVYTVEIRPYGTYASGTMLFELFEADGQRPAVIAPVITYLSSNQTAVQGGSSAFGVVAVSKPSATYQWRKAGSPIAGATNAVLDVPNVQPGDGVNYDVVITSGANTLTSQPRALSILPEFHSADTNHDHRISLIELTRVIQLYRYQNGSTRTGEYHTQATGTEDGFTLGPGAIAAYHSADFNRDGRIDTDELLRVIELYNYRDGTVLTGEYHAAANNKDGFEPGPANIGRDE